MWFAVQPGLFGHFFPCLFYWSPLHSHHTPNCRRDHRCPPPTSIYSPFNFPIHRLLVSSSHLVTLPAFQIISPPPTFPLPNYCSLDTTVQFFHTSGVHIPGATTSPTRTPPGTESVPSAPGPQASASTTTNLVLCFSLGCLRPKVPAHSFDIPFVSTTHELFTSTISAWVGFGQPDDLVQKRERRAREGPQAGLKSHADWNPRIKPVPSTP